ncbi:hypothetical protein [Cecembia rubra]|uniref:Uncharacterized protein n=1 Tax=Cecembia rubra TaxID=1485585 RepID=A0A2P8EAJ8_9BACT|nr:hypothetical protein [Cecembia rubra]PSL06498.1 hypothetical protein CLV48_102314 [Cecembia rubra]
MIKKAQCEFRMLIRIFSLMLSLFFVVLAVYDGLEEEENFEYFGEFVDEAEFDYVDFPTSISRPTGNKQTKTQRLELIKIIDQIQTILRFETFNQPDEKPAIAEVIIYQIFLLEHIISTNAP